MIQVSNAWKAAMTDVTSYTAAATVTLADSTVLSLTADEFCVKTNKFTDGLSTNKFPVGEAMSRTIQIEINNADDAYSAYDFVGATISLSLAYNNESIAIGEYTVMNPATYGETVIIQAQDDMYKADKAFETSLTYPATASELWAEICTSCGITNGMNTIPQGSFSIAAEPLGDMTYRDVIGYIAMLSGGNARINRDGALEIVNYNISDLTSLRENDVVAIDDGHGNVTVAGAVSASESDGAVIVVSGGVFTDDGNGNIVWTTSGSWDVHDLNLWHSLKVDASDTEITGVQSNGVLSGTNGYVLNLRNPLWKGQESTALATVAAAICGVPFRCFDGEYIAYPIAEFGDLARITDRKGNIYYSFITNIEFTWAAATNLKATAQPTTENASSYTSEYIEKGGLAKELEATKVKADWIELYGYMDVFIDSTATQKGGHVGYMAGSHGFPDGSTESTAGIAVANEGSTQTHYLIVTDSGVRLQEHKNSGAESSSVYLADGRFVIDCESGLIVPRGKLLSNINYGGVPMSRVASIWENSDPTASFSAQTITDARFLYYDILIFEIAWSTSYPGVVNSAFIYNGSNNPGQGSIIAQPSVTWYDGSYVSAAYRQFKINGNSIEIGSGCHATGSSVSTSANNYAIPIRIMGIMI